MEQFFFILFFLAIFFAPLGHDLSRYNLPSSLLWNDSSWIFIVLTLFCLAFFCVRKNISSRSSFYLWVFLVWTVASLALLTLLPVASSLQSILPLWVPIFVIGFLHLYTDKRSLLPVVFIFLGILTLQAQWGLLQFSLQRDIGLSFLGESPLSPSLPGVAKFSVGDTKLVRAYGPYQHANALGGAVAAGLATAAIAFLYVICTTRKLPEEVGWYLLSVSTVLFLALLITFSRTAYASFFLTVCVWIFLLYGYSLGHFIHNRFLKAGITMFCCLLLPFIILVQQRATDPLDMALLERQRGYEWFAAMFHTDMLLLGVGLGNYPSALTSFLQEHEIQYHPWEIAPIHNSLLLLVAEIGLLPTIIFLVATIYALKRLWQPSWKALFLCLVPLLPIALFDHYLISLPSTLVIVTVAAVLQLRMAGYLSELPERQRDVA